MIAKNINSIIWRVRVFAINMAAYNGYPILSGISKDRINILRSVCAVLIGKAFESFPDVPPVVFSTPHNGYLFVSILSHITNPEITRQGVKTESPRFAESTRPNFRAYTWVVDKRVIRWNRVNLPVTPMIHINAQHFPLKQSQILSMSVRVFMRPCIPHSDVKVAVRPKLKSSSCMRTGCCVPPQDSPRCSTRIFFIIRGGFPLNSQRYMLPFLGNVERQKVSSIFSKFWVKRQPH